MKNGVTRSRNLRMNTVSKSNKIPVPIEANENLSSKYTHRKRTDNDEKPMIAMGLYLSFI